MSTIRRHIHVSFQLEGIHTYYDAPEEVSFLRNPHRHMFHFSVWLEVFHNERDIEFIMFKRELEHLYTHGANYTLQLNNLSCENLAEELIDYIKLQYPNRNCIVEVSEDGENGAVLEYQHCL